MWVASNPTKAGEASLRQMGWPQEKIDLVKKLRGQQTAGSTMASTPNLNMTPTQSISGAVKTGVVVTGALSVTQNLHNVLTGKKKMHMAAKDIAVDVATASASSAVIAGTAEGIKLAAKTALPNVAKSFVKGSAPVVIASGIVEVAVDAYKGTLTPQSATVTAARTAGGWAGAEVGAASGAAVGTLLAPITAGLSIPVLAFVGGLAGGIGGAIGAGKLAKKAV